MEMGVFVATSISNQSEPDIRASVRLVNTAYYLACSVFSLLHDIAHGASAVQHETKVDSLVAY